MQTRLTLILSLLLCASMVRAHGADKPNLIVILADDLGYGDIGPFGQKIIRTPTLDTLAANGMKFTQHYSGSTVCAPSRSTLIEGRHTGHCSVRGNQPPQLTDRSLKLLPAVLRDGGRDAFLGLRARCARGAHFRSRNGSRVRWRPRRDDLDARGVRVRFIGRRGGRVPKRVVHRIEETEAQTAPTQPEKQDNRLPIDREARKQNRTLPTPKVLNLLHTQLPAAYRLAEVVGKWVWVTFKEQPAAEIRQQLAQLGFHWNRERQAWQHPCGKFSLSSAGDPHEKYSSYHPSDVKAA